MAVQRQQAAYRAEIETAVDKVKERRSGQWFRALLHQFILRTINARRSPRVIDDDGSIRLPRHTASHARDSIQRPESSTSPRPLRWAR